MTGKNCKLNPHVQKWMDVVEQNIFETCKEQKALVKLVKEAFATGEIYISNEQLEKYLSLSKYFDYETVFEWQEFVIALHDCTYYKDTGMPRWPDLFCLIGRGAGKDGTIALESVALSSEYNGIKAYDVDICANNEDQAMRPVQDIIEAFEQPENIKKLSKFFYWTKEIVKSLKTKSTIKGRTNSPKGKDGLRSGIVIFNEIHQYEDYRNINVFTTGLGKKKHPRRSYYTTQGDIREGPLDDLLEKAEGILFGGESDDGLLPFICRLDDKEEVHDEKYWPKANPSLPYLPNLLTEIRKEYKDWKKSPHSLPAFMTKRMNIPENNSDLIVAKWDDIKATNKPLPDLKGWKCTCGIDYTKVTDLASVNLHFRKGDLRYDINHTWMCLNSRDIPRMKCPWKKWAEDGRLTLVDDVEIHPSLLMDYIIEAKKKYDICMLAIDDFRFALLSNALREIGFDMKVHKNLRLIRPYDIMRVVPVIDSCFLNHYFTWGDAPELRWAVNNTKLVKYRKRVGDSTEDLDLGNYVYAKIEGKSRKTDPFMALVASIAVEGELPVTFTTRTPDFGVYSF